MHYKCEEYVEVSDVHNPEWRHQKVRSLEVGESEPEDVHNDGDSRNLEQG